MTVPFAKWSRPGSEGSKLRGACHMIALTALHRAFALASRTTSTRIRRERGILSILRSELQAADESKPTKTNGCLICAAVAAPEPNTKQTLRLSAYERQARDPAVCSILAGR